nr:tetratricopeptide repeat protein [Tatlockia sp.]
MQTKYERADIQPILYKYLFETLESINKNYGKRFFYFWDAPSELVGSKTIPSILLNSAHFENTEPDYFRLKKQTSASAALDSILLKNKHILDCTSTIILAQYNALRMTLIHFVGKEEGERRFDFLFGSKKDVSTKVCRMLISIHSPLLAMVAIGNSDETVLDINPLLCFIDFTKQVKSQEKYTLTMLQAGQFCHIKGHPSYEIKHRQGASGGMNVLVCEDNKFIYFSKQDKAVDYNTVLTHLSDKYNESPKKSFESSLLSSLFKSSSPKDMVGFMGSSVTDFLYSPISCVLSYDAVSSPFFNMLQAMNNFLNELQKKLPINQAKRPTIPSSINSSLSKEIKELDTPKKNEGISTGFFSSKPKSSSELYKEAIMLIKEGKFKEAMESCESAYELYKTTKGESSIEVGTCLSTIATCYRELGMFDKSLSTCES